MHLGVAVRAEQVATGRFGPDFVPPPVGKRPAVELESFVIWIPVMEFQGGEISCVSAEGAPAAKLPYKPQLVLAGPCDLRPVRLVALVAAAVLAGARTIQPLAA
jgi:hypothetical protein